MKKCIIHLANNDAITLNGFERCDIVPDNNGNSTIKFYSRKRISRTKEESKVYYIPKDLILYYEITEIKINEDSMYCEAKKNGII